MNQPTDDNKRTIALLYGVMNTGAPFWLFAAVRINKYQQFQEAYKNGTLDIHQFEPYGEIIVIGDGKNPPDDIILKVAELYQTDPATLMQDLQSETLPASGTGG